jgi:hypothetical protein
MEHHRVGTGESLLHHRPAPRLSILSRLQHRSGSQHTVRDRSSRNTTPNLRPSQLILLDRLPLQHRLLLRPPNLALATLSNKPLRVAAANRIAAEIVRPKRNPAAPKKDRPTLGRHPQVQAPTQTTERCRQVLARRQKPAQQQQQRGQFGTYRSLNQQATKNGGHAGTAWRAAGLKGVKKNRQRADLRCGSMTP